MSRIPSVAIPIATALIRLGADALEGKIASVGDAARALVGIGLQLVPYDELRQYLTEAGRERAELLADVAEARKFGADLDEDPVDSR